MFKRSNERHGADILSDIQLIVLFTVLFTRDQCWTPVFREFNPVHISIP